MSDAKLNLVVLRSRDLEIAGVFYEALGLRFTREQHGRGPVHLAADRDGLVLEIYPLPQGESSSSVRLGFRVDSLEQTRNQLQHAGFAPVSPPRDSPWGKRGIWTDPDGNTIELLEPA